ncbi:MAG: hypothetical protein GXP62_02165 [Oligoflexia bacterium]|nr:hypothetical protein [Oligoflexia bacterium]
MTPSLWSVPALFLALAAGCSPRLPDCAPDETYDADGNCFQRDNSLSDQMQAIVDGAPECVLLPVGDRLDMGSGCADGACAEDTYSHMVDVLGEADCQDPDQVENTMIWCSWQGGDLDAFIWDENGDNAPDSNEINQGLHLSLGWDGSDQQGLGIAISLSCFIDVYGNTDSDSIDTWDDGSVYGVSWIDRGIFIDDLDGDGYVDLLSIFGVY